MPSDQNPTTIAPDEAVRLLRAIGSHHGSHFDRENGQIILDFWTDDEAEEAWKAIATAWGAHQ